MKFRYSIVVYVLVWVVFIGGICIYEWNFLKSFQASYENEQKNLNGNFSNKDESGVDASGPFQGDNTTIQPGATQPSKVPEELHKYVITADSTMTIYLNEVLYEPTVMEEIEDGICSDLSQLLGYQIKKYNYTITKTKTDVIDVKDNKGGSIIPVGNDFVKGAYSYDSAAADKAVKAFEQYLKHISGLVALDELTGVMRRDSKAYEAVANSQQSLKWMIKAKSIEFTSEKVTNMRFYDEKHFSCDISIDLVKISDTEHERKVEETVNYEVLYENVDGKWMIYSFLTK